MHPETAPGGVTRALIQTDVELQLRLAGIPIDAASWPYLFVRVGIVPDIYGYWPVDIDVELHQGVLLQRDTSIIVDASTWSVGSLGGVRKVDFRNYVRDSIKNGSLVYALGQTRGQEGTLVWVDRRGLAEPLPAPPRVYGNIRLSPDGLRVAMTVAQFNSVDIWIYPE
jgi:hypothetical protein